MPKFALGSVLGKDNSSYEGAALRKADTTVLEELKDHEDADKPEPLKIPSQLPTLSAAVAYAERVVARWGGGGQKQQRGGSGEDGDAMSEYDPEPEKLFGDGSDVQPPWGGAFSEAELAAHWTKEGLDIVVGDSVLEPGTVVLPPDGIKKIVLKDDPDALQKPGLRYGEISRAGAGKIGKILIHILISLSTPRSTCSALAVKLFS